MGVWLLHESQSPIWITAMDDCREYINHAATLAVTLCYSNRRVNRGAVGVDA